MSEQKKAYKLLVLGSMMVFFSTLLELLVATTDSFFIQRVIASSLFLVLWFLGVSGFRTMWKWMKQNKNT